MVEAATGAVAPGACIALVNVPAAAFGWETYVATSTTAVPASPRPSSALTAFVVGFAAAEWLISPAASLVGCHKTVQEYSLTQNLLSV